MDSFTNRLQAHQRPSGFTGTVTRISDADTFTVEDSSGRSQTIRLSYIDAPETAHPEWRARRAQPFANTATQMAERLAPVGSQVYVAPTQLDAYGRTVGEVFGAEGSVNLRLVQEGLAYVPSRTQFDTPYTRHQYAMAALDAHNAKGLIYNLQQTPESFRQRYLYIQREKARLREAQALGDPEAIATARESLEAQRQRARRTVKQSPKPFAPTKYDLGEFGYLRKTDVLELGGVTGAPVSGTQQALPYMPTRLSESFYDRYIGRDLPRYVSTTATYEMLTARSAPNSIISFDREVGSPSIGHQINRALGFKFYHEGYGILGSAARTAGRFLDTVTGHHIFQREKLARQGKLSGTPMGYHRMQYSENELPPGPFERILAAGMDASKGLALAMVGYGATFAAQLGVMALQEQGLAHLSSQAAGEPQFFQKMFRSIFSTPDSRYMDAAVDYVRTSAMEMGEVLSEQEIMGRAHRVSLFDPDKAQLHFEKKHANILRPVGFINALRRYESSLVQSIGSATLGIAVPNENQVEAQKTLAKLSKSIELPILVRDKGIENFGRSRVQRLAESVDEIARHVPANPIFWIPAMRDWVGLENAQDRSLAEVYGDNLLQSTILKFDTTARVTANVIRQPIETYRNAMRLFEDSRSLTSLEQAYARNLHKQFQAVRAGAGIAEPTRLLDSMTSTADVMRDKSIIHQVKLLNQQATSYVGYNLGQDADQMVISKSSRFNRNVKTLLMVGGVLAADQLADQFILRTQGASLHTQLKLFDAVRDDEGQVLAYKFNGTMPVATTLGVAGVSGVATGTLFPYFAKTRLDDTPIGKTLYEMGDYLREGAVHRGSGYAALSASLDKSQALLRNKVSVKAKFNMRTAAVGAVFGLMAAKMGYAAVASMMNQAYNQEAGVELSPETESVSGLLKATLNRTRYTVGQGPLADASPSSVVTRGVLGNVLKQLQSGDPQASLGMNVFSIAQQTNLGFVQFATLLRMDPTRNVTTLTFGMQLLPMLGMGVNPTLPIGLKLRPTETSQLRLTRSLYQEDISDSGPLHSLITSTDSVLSAAAKATFLDSFTYVQDNQFQAALGFLGAAQLTRGTLQGVGQSVQNAGPGSLLYGFSNLAGREIKYLSPTFKMVNRGYSVIESFTSTITGLGVAVPQAMGRAAGEVMPELSHHPALRLAGKAMPLYLAAASAIALTDPDYGPVDYESPIARAAAIAQVGGLGYLSSKTGLYSTSEYMAQQLKHRGPIQKVLETVPGVRAQQEIIATSPNLFRRSAGRMKLAGTLLVGTALASQLAARSTGELTGEQGLKGLYRLLPALRLTGVDESRYRNERGNLLRAGFQTTSELVKKLTRVDLSKLTGLYTDTPNLFSPLLYPTGVSLDQNSTKLRFYTQLASPTSDLSYSSYGLLNFQLSPDAIKQLSSVLDYDMDRLDSSPDAAQEILAMYRGATPRRKGSRIEGFTPYERMALSSPGLQRAYARRQYMTDWLRMQRASELAIDQLKESYQLGRRATAFGRIPYQGYDPLQGLLINFAEVAEGELVSQGNRETLDELMFNMTSRYNSTTQSGFFTQLGRINQSFTQGEQTRGSQLALGGMSLILSLGTWASLGVSLMTITGGMERAFFGENLALQQESLRDAVRDFNRVARSGKFDLSKTDNAVMQVFSRDREVITAAHKIRMPEGMNINQKSYWYHVQRTYSDLVKLSTEHFTSPSPHLRSLLEGEDVRRLLAEEFQTKLSRFLDEDFFEEARGGFNPKRYDVLYGDDRVRRLTAMLGPDKYDDLYDYAQVLKYNRELSVDDQLARLNVRRVQLESQAFEQFMMRLGELDTTNNVSVDKVFEPSGKTPRLKPVSQEVLGSGIGASWLMALYSSYIQEGYTLAESSTYLLSSETGLRDRAATQFVRTGGRVGLTWGLERLLSKTLLKGNTNPWLLTLAAAPFMLNYEGMKGSRPAQFIAGTEKKVTGALSHLVAGTGEILSQATGPMADAAIAALFNPIGETIARTYEKSRESFLMAFLTSVLLPESLYKQQIYKDPVQTFTGAEPFTYNADLYYRSQMSAGLNRYSKPLGYVDVYGNLRGSAVGFQDQYISSRYFDRPGSSIFQNFSLSSTYRISPSQRLALERRQAESDYTVYGAMMRRPAPAADNRVPLFLTTIFNAGSRQSRQLNTTLLPLLREEVAGVFDYLPIQRLDNSLASLGREPVRRSSVRSLMAVGTGQQFKRSVFISKLAADTHPTSVKASSGVAPFLMGELPETVTPLTYGPRRRWAMKIGRRFRETFPGFAWTSNLQEATPPVRNPEYRPKRLVLDTPLLPPATQPVNLDNATFGHQTRVLRQGVSSSRFYASHAWVSETVKNTEPVAKSRRFKPTVRGEFQKGINQGWENLRYVLDEPQILSPFRDALDFFRPVLDDVLFDAQRLTTALFLGVTSTAQSFAESVLEGFAYGFKNLRQAVPTIGLSSGRPQDYTIPRLSPVHISRPLPISEIYPALPGSEDFKPFGLLPAGPETRPTYGPRWNWESSMTPGPLGPNHIDYGPIRAPYTQWNVTDQDRLAMRFKRLRQRSGRNLRHSAQFLKDAAPVVLDLASLFSASQRIRTTDPDYAPGIETAAAYRESLGVSFSTMAASMASLQGRSFISTIALAGLGFVLGNRMGYRMAQYDVHEYQDSRNKLYATALLAAGLSVGATLRSKMIAGHSRSEVVFDDMGRPRIDMSQSLRARLRSPRSSTRYRLAEFELLHEKAHLVQARRHLERFGRPGFTGRMGVLQSRTALIEAGASSEQISLIDRLSMRSAEGLRRQHQLDALTFQQIYEQEFEANTKAFRTQSQKYGVSKASRIIERLDRLQGLGRFEGFQNLKTGLFHGNLDRLGANAVQMPEGYFYNESLDIQSIHDLESSPEDPLRRAMGRNEEGKSAQRFAYQHSPESVIRDFDRAEFLSAVNPDVEAVKVRRQTSGQKLNNHAKPVPPRTIKDLPRYQTVVFFDLETSYKDSPQYEITDARRYPPIAEVAYRKVRIDTTTGQVVEEMARGRSLVQPYYDKGEMVFEKYSTEALQKGRRADDVLGELLGKTDGAILAGHNISTFDIPVMQATLHRLGQKSLAKKLEKLVVSGQYIDTLRDIDPKFYREAGAKRLSLGSVYEAMTGKPLMDAHTAMADVDANVEVYQGLLKRLNTTDPLSTQTSLLDAEFNLLEDQARQTRSIRTQIEVQLQDPDLPYSRRLELEAELVRVNPSYTPPKGGGLVKFSELKPTYRSASKYAGNKIGPTDILDVLDPVMTLYSSYRNRMDYLAYMANPRPTEGGVSRATQQAYTQVGLHQGAVFSLLGMLAGASTGSRGLMFAIGFLGPYLGLDITGRGNDYISEVMRDASADGIVQPGVLPTYMLRLSTPSFQKDLNAVLPGAKSSVLGLVTRYTEHLSRRGIQRPGLYLGKQLAKFGTRGLAGYAAGSVLTRHLVGYGYTRDEGRKPWKHSLIALGGLAGSVFAQGEFRDLFKTVGTGWTSGSIGRFTGGQLRPHTLLKASPAWHQKLAARITGKRHLAQPRPRTIYPINRGFMLGMSAFGAGVGLIATDPEASADQKARAMLMGASAYPALEMLYRQARPSVTEGSALTALRKLAAAKLPSVAPGVSKLTQHLASVLYNQKMTFARLHKAGRQMSDVFNTLASYEIDQFMSRGLLGSPGAQALLFGGMSTALLYYLQNEDEKNPALALAGGAAASSLVYAPSLYRSAVNAMVVKGQQPSLQLPHFITKFLENHPRFKLPFGWVSKLISSISSVITPITRRVSIPTRVFRPLGQGLYTGGAGSLGYVLGDLFDKNEGVSTKGIIGAGVLGTLSALSQYGHRDLVKAKFRTLNRYAGLAGIGAIAGGAIGNLVDDDNDSSLPYILGAGAGLGLAYMLKPFSPRNSKLFARLFKGAVEGGARHKALDYLLRRGGVISGSLRILDYGLSATALVSSVRLMSQVDNYHGASRERYTQAVYNATQQSITGLTMLMAVKNDLLGGLLGIPAAMATSYWAGKRGEFLGKARATETDLLVESVSNSILQMKVSRLVRHIPQFMKVRKSFHMKKLAVINRKLLDVQRGSSAYIKLQEQARQVNAFGELADFAQDFDGGRISRLMNYERAGDMLDATNDLFKQMKVFNAGLAQRNTRTAKLLFRLSSGAINSSEAVQRAAANGLQFSIQGLRTLEKNSKFVRTGAQAGRKSWRLARSLGEAGTRGFKAFRSSKAGKVAGKGIRWAGRLLDYAEYGIATYDVVSGYRKAARLGTLSSKEQYQYAYGQMTGGLFRGVATPLMSIAAKSLYLAGGVATGTVIGAPVGALLIGAGIGLDVFGSDIASAVGHRLGRSIGTGKYYWDNPGRLPRDIGVWWDKMLGQVPRQRLHGDAVIELNLRREREMRGEEESESRWGRRVTNWFDRFKNFLGRLNPFRRRDDSQRRVGELQSRPQNRSQSEQRRVPSNDVQVDSKPQTRNEPLVSEETRREVTRDPSATPVQPPTGGTEAEPQARRVQGGVRIAPVASFRNNPDVHPQKNNPLALTVVSFDEERNTVLVSQREEDDAYQVNVNSPGGVSLETAETRPFV